MMGNSSGIEYLNAGADFPVLSLAALGSDESGDSIKWGHAVMAQFAGDIKPRWYGETNAAQGILGCASPILIGLKML